MHSKWFLPVSKSSHRRLRLFCLPYAGGMAANYLPWAGLLQRDIEALAVQLPGRGNRIVEPCIVGMGEMADRLLQAMEPYLHEPYILLGHSMGARISIALMDKLCRAGLNLPVHFIASGCRAPHYPVRDDPIHALPHAEFVRELEALEGTPEEVLKNRELMDIYLPVLRADMQVVETYIRQPERKLPCRVSVFGGEGDRRIGPEHLRGWQQHFSEPVAVELFPGKHFFINSDREAVVGAVNAIAAGLLQDRYTAAQL